MAEQGLKGTIQELLEYKREEEWRRAGVPEGDIEFSRVSGMNAQDVRTFREFTSSGLLIVVRCPKVTGRPHHGIFRPKPKAYDDPRWKSGDSGLSVVKKEIVVTKMGSSGPAEPKKIETKLFVSDYDLMSVWKSGLKGFEKIFISAERGAPRGAYTPQARELLRNLNKRLVSRIQHGCQDDYHSPKNPNVKAGDRFAAFNNGSAEYLADMYECGRYYQKFHLTWPYNEAGKYIGPGHG